MGRFIWSIFAMLAVGMSLPVLNTQQVQAQSSSDRIAAIVIDGNERIPNATIETYMAVRVGDPFNDTALDNSLKNLFATGLFDDVAINRRGEEIYVVVVENPMINRVAFEGNRAVEDETLTAEVQLRPRIVYTRARVQSAVSRILEIYRRNGRFAARVEPKIVQLDQNRVDLIFEINEGRETGIGGISFIGNENYADSTLRDILATKEVAWYRLFTDADTYDPDRLAFDEELLRRFYRARGYAEFAVVSSLAELTPDGGEFYITFTIDEGARFTFGDISIDSSAISLSPEELQPLLETLSGAEFNADEVESTIQLLTDELGERGFAFAQIEPLSEIDRATNTINLSYRINLGGRVYVERINIRGNVRTLDQVIRREFRLAEGDAFNTALLRRSIQRIRNLGFFEDVRVTTPQGSTSDRVLIDVEVVEMERLL